MAGEREYDERVISNDSMEGSDSFGYYANCLAFLDAFLDQQSIPAGADVREGVCTLIAWLGSSPEERDTACAEEAALDMMLYGMIGKALFFLRGQNSPQFRKELGRLFSKVSNVRANAWLFHVAGRLAKAGYTVEFLKERSREGKVPDFVAKGHGITAYFEATARSQRHRSISSVSSLL